LGVVVREHVQGNRPDDPDRDHAAATDAAVTDAAVSDAAAIIATATDAAVVAANDAVDGASAFLVADVTRDDAWLSIAVADAVALDAWR
jgi:hypothetical protein